MGHGEGCETSENRQRSKTRHYRESHLSTTGPYHYVDYNYVRTNSSHTEGTAFLLINANSEATEATEERRTNDKMFCVSSGDK